jgi:hypothetical protein
MDPILQTALTTLATSGLTLGVLKFLGGEWIATRLRESVAAEYRKAFETFKADLDWQTKR